MANLIFDKVAQERYNACYWDKEMNAVESLTSCFARLLLWDGTIHISPDFDEKSFFFRQVYENGTNGICGGIIYHGARDGYGNGAAPTHSVCIEPTQGYSIHT